MDRFESDVAYSNTFKDIQNKFEKDWSMDFVGYKSHSQALNVANNNYKKKTNTKILNSIRSIVNKHCNLHEANTIIHTG